MASAPNSVVVYPDEVLGVGAYGKVCKAKYGKLPCAAKLLHDTMRQGDKYVEKFEKECQFLSELKHPNVVQYLGMNRSPESHRLVILMELMDKSLTRFLKQFSHSLPYHIQLNICHDVALALSYLHSNAIIHRDLSSNNVLLYGDGSKAKVTDFGMSKLIDANVTPLTQCPGSAVYMPPEALTTPPHYSSKLDCFSHGVLTIQVITKNFPRPAGAHQSFQDPNCPDQHFFCQVPEIERRKKDIDLVSPDHPLLPQALQCLEINDMKRPSSDELCDRLVALRREEKYSQSVEQTRGQASQLQRLQEVVEQKDTELSEKNAIIKQERAEIEVKNQAIKANCQALQEQYQIMLEQLEYNMEQTRGQASHLQRLQEVVKQKDTELTEKNAIIKQERAEIEAKNKAIEANRQDIQEQHQMIEQLQHNMEQTRGQASQLQRLQEVVKQKDTELSEKNAIIKQERAEIEAKNKAIEANRQALQEQHQMIEQLQHNMEQTREQASHLQRLQEVVKQKDTELSEKNAIIKQERAEIEAKNKAIEANHQEQHQVIEQLQHNMEQTRGQASHLQRLQEVVKQKDTELSEKNAIIIQERAEIEAKNKAIEANCRTIQEQHQMIEQLQHNMEQTRGQASHLQRLQEVVKQKDTELSEKNAIIIQERAEIEAKNKAIEANCRTIQEQHQMIEQLREENSRKEIDELKNSNTALQEQIKEYTQTISVQRKEIDMLEERNAALQEQIKETIPDQRKDVPTAASSKERQELLHFIKLHQMQHVESFAEMKSTIQKACYNTSGSIKQTTGEGDIGVGEDKHTDPDNSSKLSKPGTSNKAEACTTQSSSEMTTTARGTPIQIVNNLLVKISKLESRLERQECRSPAPQTRD